MVSVNNANRSNTGSGTYSHLPQGTVDNTVYLSTIQPVIAKGIKVDSMDKKQLEAFAREATKSIKAECDLTWF